MRNAALPSIAVGFFDGVHLGHRAILEGAEAALTFVDHPLKVLAPEKAPMTLMTFEERVRLIDRPVIALPFTKCLAEMSAAEFADRYLKGYKVRCGENWRFGKSGEGNAEWLKRYGWEVEVVPYIMYEGAAISSTRIREALKAGKIEDAEAMLGRKVTVRGVEVRGKGEGRKLGFPTINLKLGVYAAEVNGERAVVNYGYAPTFGERGWTEPMMEVHLLKYLREERRFDSSDALKKQIAADCERARS